MKFHKRFEQFVKERSLFTKNDRILLAISGGADSVALAHLLKRCDFNFALAHCNFKLRGTESESDEAFVRALGKQFAVPVYVKTFDTKTLAKKAKQSTQLFARQVRYEWFRELRKTEDFQYIATAHHLNDSIETVLFNLSRGCGISGLHGVNLKTETLVRPLLFCKKEEILEYLKRNTISYREDASNATTDYNRNRIRHNVIPQLKKINSSLESSFEGNIQRFIEVEWLYKFALENIEKEIVEDKGNQRWISIPKLLSYPVRSSILHELLKPYGFSQAEKILEDIEKQSGAIYEAAAYRLLRDREHLIISPLKEANKHDIWIQKEEKQIKLPGFDLIIKEATIPFQVKNAKEEALLDAEKLEFPLLVRNWQEGDVFFPIGMQGKKKKLSKYFKDIKLNRLEKEQVQVLFSQGEVCWLIGYRMDERFKVTTKTKKALLLTKKRHQ